MNNVHDFNMAKRDRSDDHTESRLPEDDHLTEAPEQETTVAPTSVTRYHHLRNHGRGKKYNHTLALLIEEDYIHIGIAQCSKKDQFSRKIGRQVAVGRAKMMKDRNDGVSRRSTGWGLTLHRVAYGFDQYKAGDKKLDESLIEIALSEISDIRTERSN
jgi:hypothetical protein